MDPEDAHEEQLFEGEDQIGDDSIGLTEGEQWMSLNPWSETWHTWFLSAVLLVIVIYGIRTIWYESKSYAETSAVSVLPARMAQYTDMLKSPQGNKSRL